MVTNEKSAIRRLLRAQRRQLTPEVVDAAGAAVQLQLGVFSLYREAVRVIAYIPTENEIPTAGIMAESFDVGREVYLPRTGAEGRFARWRIGERLVRGLGGVWEPCDGSPLPNGGSAVAFIPLVGWDEKGTRLGRGDGYYDRVLGRQVRGIVRVGLAYEFQRCPEIPRDPWDVSLDYIITEQRVIPCGDRGAVQPGWLQKGGS
jgi:5-formyltetrahydrofolate cyclo-ligase